MKAVAVVSSRQNRFTPHKGKDNSATWKRRSRIRLNRQHTNVSQQETENEDLTNNILHKSAICYFQIKWGLHVTKETQECTKTHGQNWQVTQTANNSHWYSQFKLEYFSLPVPAKQTQPWIPCIRAKLILPQCNFARVDRRHMTLRVPDHCTLYLVISWTAKPVQNTQMKGLEERNRGKVRRRQRRNDSTKEPFRYPWATQLHGPRTDRSFNRCFKQHFILDQPKWASL